MRVPQLLLCACPQCHSALTTLCTKYQDDQMEDQYIEAKFNNLKSKFSIEEINEIVKNQLKWEYSTDAELMNLLYVRTIYEGTMECTKCKQIYEIKNRLGRFVKDAAE